MTMANYITISMAQARHALQITTDVAIYCQVSTSCVSLLTKVTHYQTLFAYSVNILQRTDTTIICIGYILLELIDHLKRIGWQCRVKYKNG